MANFIEDWSTTAGSNTTVGGISIAEGTFARNLNDGIRAVMSDVASWRDATNGVKITTGSSNAYVLSSGLSLAALAQKVRVTFEANHTNTGASTLALDGLSATDIRRVDGTALTAGDITSGGIYDVAYEASAAKFLLLNPTPTPTSAGVFTTIELGGATDTTLSRASAGVLAVEGVSVLMQSLLTTRGDIIYRDASAAARLAKGTSGQILRQGADDPAWSNDTVEIGAILNGGGSAIATGIAGDIEIPYGGTIAAVRMFADQSGSMVVDIWKDTYANYPPTVADTITAAAKPTISTATKAEDATLTGWTTTVTAGDILRFNVDSCSTITRCAISLTIRKT